MRTGTHTLLFLIITVTLTMLPTREPVFAQEDEISEEDVLVETVISEKSLELPVPPESSTNASLPAPGGGSIEWQVGSKLELYENAANGRYAKCRNYANTTATVYRLYLERGQFWADSRLKDSVSEYNRGNINEWRYSWISTHSYGDWGQSFFECLGLDHAAQVTDGGPFYFQDSSVTANW